MQEVALELSGRALVEMELADRPSGMRDSRIRDLGGNRLGFGEPIADAG